MEQNVVTLGRLSERDREAVAEILTDEVVAKTYMVPEFTSPEQVEKLFRRLMELSSGEERYVRGIYVGDALVGFLNDVGISGDSIELGWVVHPRYHNRGYATSAVKLAIGELFAKGFHEVVAGAFQENRASTRVMEKSGMTRQEQTEEIEYRGAVHTCVYYAIKG